MPENKIKSYLRKEWTISGELCRDVYLLYDNLIVLSFLTSETYKI
jgi:hypothetical protein